MTMRASCRYKQVPIIRTHPFCMGEVRELDNEGAAYSIANSIRLLQIRSNKKYSYCGR